MRHIPDIVSHETWTSRREYVTGLYSVAEVILEELKKSGANTLGISRRGIWKKEESMSNKHLHAAKSSVAMWAVEQDLIAEGSDANLSAWYCLKSRCLRD